MADRNDINYGRYLDSSGYGMRYSDSDVDHASEDSDVSAAPSSRRGKGSAKACRSRGPKLRTLNRWTPEEHERLAYLVAKWGSEKNWAKVAEEMPGRTGKQCRERWLNHMRPGIIKGNWSFEEEFLLAQCHAVVGSHWSKMTKRLPGRTENSIKNFWNATLRSKAPHKRRGILWLYMQQQTSQEGENVDAFLISVSRLYETQELPGYWAQLMEEGRLSERALRAVLRAEKEFLENPDAELHPLAMPHPTHGLFGTSDTGAGGAGAAAATGGAAAAGSCPESDTGGYDATPAMMQHQQQQQLQHHHQQHQAGAGQAHTECGTTAAAAAAAAAAAVAAVAAGCAFAPSSPIPVPGLTPRFPGGEYGPGQHACVPSSAAFEGAALAGLALPPEVLAALGPPEVWTALPSAQGRAGPFSAGGGAGSMEPLMPSLGLNSDLRPSGTEGAFGGNGANNTIWACLPSFRGLGHAGATAAGAAAAPGGGAGGSTFTPGQNGAAGGGDPLRLLEPYGALHGHHHSSSNSIQTRPDSALEFEQPQVKQSQAAGADSMSRDSSSRPGSSLDQVPSSDGAHDSLAATAQQRQQPVANRSPADGGGVAGGDKNLYHRYHQQQQRQQAAAAAAAAGGNCADSPAGHEPNRHQQAAATGGQGGQRPQAWWGQANGAAAAQQGLQAAVGYNISAWAGQYHHQQQQPARNCSPTESGTHSEPAYAPGQVASAGAAPGYNTSSGHGAQCNCNVCTVRYQHRGQTSVHNSPSPSLTSSQAMAGGGVAWDQGGKAAANYTQQQQLQQQQYGVKQEYPRMSDDSSQGTPAAAAWSNSAANMQHAAAAQQQGLSHAGHQQQQQQQLANLENKLEHANSAAGLPVSRLQHQHSGTHSPFARHANTVWDAAGAATAPPEAAAAVGYAHSSVRPAAHGVTGWPGPAQQQQPQASQQGQFSNASRCLESPPAADTLQLQHLLDSAAAQAGLSAEDICAWLAAATNTSSAAQDTEEHEQQQQQQQEHVQQQQQPQQQHDWLAEFAGAQQGRTERAHGLGPLTLSDAAPPLNNTAGAGAQDATFACSILEALLTSRHSAQLGDILMSPAGLAGSAALLQGSLPPTPAGQAASAALQAAVAGLKRERSLPEAHDDTADLLIEQPRAKLPRVF